MAIVFALGAAAFYGSADFVGGLAARRTAALSVALGTQLAGLAVLAAVLPLLGAADVARADLIFGAAAGVFGGLGVVVVYQTLARGPMSVVAPTTALSASAVPVVAGLLLGDRPGLGALVGIAGSFLAIALITREGGSDRPTRSEAIRTLLPALGGGVIFGLFFVCLHQAGPGAGLWPLVAARLTSVPILAVLVLARRTPFVGRAGLGPVAVSGALDMAANVLYLLAAHHGMLAVVAAVTGLYPAATVALAQGRLGERMVPIQHVGLGVAALAAVLIAA